MTESPESDTVHPQRRTERTRLELKIYDALVRDLGLIKIEEQADFHGVGRPHWSAIRNGHKSPSSALALKVAEQLEVDPRSLWRRERIAV